MRSRIGAKRYLGDGVYVELEPVGLVLTTENGVEVTNRIVLEGEVWMALQRYVADVNHAAVLARIAESEG